jgi:amidophosphoribosyltransferase
MVKENCGVVGIFSNGDVNVIPMVIDALRALQHRGQEAWGLAIPNRAPLKRIGLVSASSGEFKKITEEYASHSAIGHVRYSTVGKSDLESAQPLKVKDLCVAHNGTISNVEELSNLVGGCTFTPQNASDTLVAAQRLVSLITENGKLGSALSILKNEMVGSYCFTFLSDDDAVYAARDPKGFRPMVMGHKEDGDVHIVTSESSAISAIGAKLVRDVVPGELIKINKDGLAKKYPISDADVVIPVPDSARPAALGFAQELGIQFDEGLLKDRYSKKGPLRSFIEPHQSDRVEINRWIIPIREVIEDKHVVVIDDSLVRGTSSRAIIKALRRSGAKKISMMVTYPPIKFPCYAGIDFPSQEELATFDGGKDLTEKEMIEKVRNDIGADFLGYNDAENLANAVGIPKDSMCFTCATGDYTPLGITPNFNKMKQMKNV